MNRTGLIRAIVAVAALCLAVWIARNTYWDETEVETPAKGDAAQNPYYALEHFIQSLGMETHMAGTLQMPPNRHGFLFAGNVQADLLRRRVESLKPWVERGGHLIVGGMTVWLDPQLQSWSGVAPSIRNIDKSDDNGDTAEASVQPKTTAKGKSRPPLRAEAKKCEPLTVALGGEPTEQTLLLCGSFNEFAFKSKQTPEWAASNPYGIQSLRLKMGEGTLTILPRSLVAGNSNIRQGDHAKLILAASGMHRGDIAWLYLPSQSEKLFAMLWRIAAPGIVVILVCIALVIFRQLPRFGTPLPVPLALRRSLAEQIRAHAAFAWRTRQLGSLRKAARRALDESGVRLIASYKRLDTRQQAALLASLTGVNAQVLSAAMTKDAAGSPAVQRSAIAFLQTTRRALLQRLKNSRTTYDI